MEEKYCLKIINAPKLDVKEVILGKERFIIGKGPSSDLLLDSKDIANEHAVIFQGFSQWYIKPLTLDLQNSLRVNYDVLKTQSHRLTVGDVITLASYNFMFAKYVPEGVTISLKSSLPDLEPRSQDLNSLSSGQIQSVKSNTDSLVDKLDCFLSDFLRILAASKVNSNGKMRVGSALQHQFLENGKEFASLVRKLEDENCFNQRYISVLESDNEDLHKFYKNVSASQYDDVKKVETELRFNQAKFDNYRAEISVELNKLKLELWKKEEEVLDEKETNAKLRQQIVEIEKNLKGNQPEFIENSFSIILKNYLEHKVSKLEQKCIEAAGEIDSALTSYRQESQKNVVLMIKIKSMEENTSNLQQRVSELENSIEKKDAEKKLLQMEENLRKVEKSKQELQEKFEKNLKALNFLKKMKISLSAEKAQIEMDLKEKLRAQESEINDKDKQIDAFLTKLKKSQDNINSLRREKEELAKKDALTIENLQKDILLWKEMHLEKSFKIAALTRNISENENTLEQQRADFAKNLFEKEKLVEGLQKEFEKLHTSRSTEVDREQSNVTLKEALRNCDKKDRELSILREAYSNIETNLLKVLTSKEEMIGVLKELTDEQTKLISGLKQYNCLNESESKYWKDLQSQMETKFKEAKTKLDSVTTTIKEEFNCAICAGLLTEAVAIRCGHTFCFVCINTWKERKQECPICRSYFLNQAKVPAIDKFIEKASKEICFN